MPRCKLTDRVVQALKPPAEGQRDYFDEGLAGFGVRVSVGGKKSFILMYRVGRRLRRFTLGRYPHLSLADARDKAREALQKVARGGDPMVEKIEDRQAETFKELAEEYLSKHASKKRSGSEDERILRRELLPRLGPLRAKSITRRQVREVLDKIADRGAGVMANRTLALVRKVFNFGIQHDIVVTNPCADLARLAEEQPRDRVLTEEQIRAVWGALDAEPAWFASAIRLYLLTAQRKHEILGMRWDEIDLASGWWTIPSERAKNGLAHRVWLNASAQRLLKELRLRSAGSLFVFPSPRGDQPIATAQKPLVRIREAAGVDFGIHDLRRTSASHMTGMGISRLTVSKILNHAEKGVTAVYDRHSYDAEKREALDAWGKRLIEIIEKEPRGSAQLAG